MEAKTVINGGASMPAHLAEEAANRPHAMPEGVVVICHENEVPAFVETELERLYGNVFSSLPHFRATGGLPMDTNTYVARKNGEIIAMFLFRREKRQVRVLNEGMVLPEEEVRRFADTIFSRYKSVSVVSFHAVPVATWRLSYPHQRYTCTEDIVLTLPESAEAYLASLGKNTRRNIKRYMDKLKRSLPSFRIDFYEKEAAGSQQVHEIIEFNRARIGGKNKAFAIDDEERDMIGRLVKARGVVGVATIDGRTCGGCLGYLIGDNYFFRVISHDPKYNDYSIGFLCCYLLICECIARRCKQFNFMQDGYDYKLQLGAAARKLDHVAIYRSHLHLLLNAGPALKLAAQGYARKAKIGLQGAARKQDSFYGRLVRGVFVGLRKLRHLASGFSDRRG
jgi:hypothetical protein